MEPLLCEWDGTAFIPARRHAKACDDNLVVGERYMITAELPRNMAAHRAYFAEIAAIWRTLPEDIAEQHPSPESLRKWALCKTGYCTESRQVFTTSRDAVLAASFAAAASDYSIVEVSGNVVRIWKPESQRVNAMGADRFKRSKNDVLDLLIGMVGVTRDQLASGAQEAA